MSDAGEIVGMVDVLKLTYATLDQVCFDAFSSKHLANYSRSTTSAQQTVKAQHGTSSGCPWTLVIPNQ
jgi:hypothetical protein